MPREHICPVWIGHLLASPIRRLMHDPRAICGRNVREGMTVFEPGCAMGFFTLELARLVGSSGRVVAVDVQPGMLERLRRRARRAGLDDRIEARLATRDDMGVLDLEGKVDFALAFYMVHELRDQAAFFELCRKLLAPGRALLVSEPKGHVREDAFARMLDLASGAGLEIAERPRLALSRSAVLVKT